MLFAKGTFDAFIALSLSKLDEMVHKNCSSVNIGGVFHACSPNAGIHCIASFSARE